MLGISQTPPPRISDFAAALVFAGVAVSVLDDFLYIHYQPEITSFVLIDWAKKTAIFFICILPLSLRAVSRQALWAPSVPWGGEGWLNPNVLLITFVFFLIDQALLWIFLVFFNDPGQPALYAFPTYADDVVKYLDLGIGLFWNSVAEELFYRPILLAVLWRFVPHLGARILLAGILFGAAHWFQGTSWVVGIAITGCLFTYLYCLTRSIIPGIVIHTLHNLIVFTP